MNLYKLNIALISFVFFCGVGFIPLVYALHQHTIFSTWEGFEVDKCASIWLIKRFINKNAIIKFYPRGTPIKQGIPFDVPNGKLRRYYNMSTFESILYFYNLKDPRLIYLGNLIHDIEVNIWEKKRFPKSLMIRESINNIISSSTDDIEIIQKSLSYFDSLYSSLKLQEGNSKSQR